MKIVYLLIFFLISCSQGSKSKNKLETKDLINYDRMINETENVSDLTISNVVSLDLTNQIMISNSFTASAEVFCKTIYSLNGKEVASLHKDAFGLSVNFYLPENNIVELTVSGTLSGSFSIHNLSKMKMVLSDITITSLDGPAINIQSHKKTFLVLDGSNYLTDSSTYSLRSLPDGSEMDLKSTLFSEGAVCVSGTGNLSITGKKKHAFASDEHIIIKDGTINAVSNKKDAIRANTAFILKNGTVNLNTLANAGKGIKVDGKEDPNFANGYVKIDGGNLSINSHDKGITASWETSEDFTTEITSDDPIPSVVINGGNINITTFGTPVETGSGKLSPEGIESKGELIINEGTITLNTTDDALNGIIGITINGGKIYSKSSFNDALDSNGFFRMTGGIAILKGANFPESGIDSDQGVFSNTGGILVAIGGINSTPDDTVSTQNAVLLESQNIHLIMIKNSNNELVFAYDNIEAVDSIFISTPSLLDNTNYSLFYGGTVDSSDSNFNGLYLGNLSSASGSLEQSFVTSGRLSNLQ